MKKFLRDIRVQKLFLPLAFLLILGVWCAAKWGDPRHPLCYIAVILGIIFLVLDRQLKPRERERLARQNAQSAENALQEPESE